MPNHKLLRNKTETKVTRNTILFLYLFPLLSFLSDTFIFVFG